MKKLIVQQARRISRESNSQRYSTFQVSEVHNRGRDTAVPCPYGNRRAIGVYFINVESAVFVGWASRPFFLDGRDAHPTKTIKIVSYLILIP